MSSPILQIKHLKKTYKQRNGSQLIALNDINFSVNRGEIVGILGPNGAGKTSAIKCISGILTPTYGEIMIDGINALKRPNLAKQKISTILEGNRNIYWKLTVKENLEFFFGLQGIKLKEGNIRVQELIEVMNLHEKTNIQAQKLSRGMQQRLVLACALVKNTPMLLLDEPTLGLDVESSYDLRRIIKEMSLCANKTILLSSHDMFVVQDICKRIIIINEGRIIQDDLVGNILKSIDVDQYHIETIEPISQCQLKKMEPFDYFIFDKKTEGRNIMRVDIKNADQLGHVLTILNSTKYNIKQIERSKPDLESVFLQMIQKGITL